MKVTCLIFYATSMARLPSITKFWPMTYKRKYYMQILGYVLNADSVLSFLTSSLMLLEIGTWCRVTVDHAENFR